MYFPKDWKNVSTVMRKIFLFNITFRGGFYLIKQLLHKIQCNLVDRALAEAAEKYSTLCSGIDLCQPQTALIWGGPVLGKPDLGAVLPECGGTRTVKEIPCYAAHSSCRRLWIRDFLQASPPQSPHNLQGSCIIFSAPQQRKILSFSLGRSHFRAFQHCRQTTTLGWYPKDDRTHFCCEGRLSSGREGEFSARLRTGREYRTKGHQRDPSKLRVGFGCCKGLVGSETL